MVCGDGPNCGEVLATHPLVDMVSFTGSTAVGRKLHALGAATIKRGERPESLSNTAGADCGGVQWKNAVFLFVNVDKQYYNNNFTDGGSRMSWFATERLTEGE